MKDPKFNIKMIVIPNTKDLNKRAAEAITSGLMKLAISCGQDSERNRDLRKHFTLPPMSSDDVLQLVAQMAINLAKDISDGKIVPRLTETPEWVKPKEEVPLKNAKKNPSGKQSLPKKIDKKESAKKKRPVFATKLR